MRSGLVAALMGVGGIFAAFGATVLVIAIFSRINHWLVVPAEMSIGTLTVLVGGAMFVAGYLLNRMGRRSNDRATA